MGLWKLCAGEKVRLVLVGNAHGHLDPVILLNIAHLFEVPKDLLFHLVGIGSACLAQCDSLFLEQVVNEHQVRGIMIIDACRGLPS